MEFAYSINGVPIRLSYERWYHITESHDDLASYFHEILDTVENPEIVLRGNKNALKAVKHFGGKLWLVVIYRELSSRDGFVITAYFLDKKPEGETIWRR